ncbi:MAG: C45 family autoproteolytic acyltransferase/hydrolase, partial [Deltaproteobacteria bacterium]
MVRLRVYLFLAICLQLLLSACGDSGSSNYGVPSAIVTNELILPKTGSNYQEVRHIVLRGTNYKIGKALAQISNDYYQAQMMSFSLQIYKESRNSYIQQFFPNLAERQKGIAEYYGSGASDLRDTSALWYDMQPVKCSAIFFPKTVTANGHSFQARDMDFYTVDMWEFTSDPPVPGHGNKMFSRNFVLETYPQDGGYAAMVVGTYDLLNGAYDGFNEHGLTISGLVDQGLSNTPGGTVTQLNLLPEQTGLSYLQMVRLILEGARNIEEAEQLVSKLTVYFPLDGIHFLLGDRTGKSTILEFYKKNPEDLNLSFIFIPQPTDRPAIMTNHSIRVYPDPSYFVQPVSIEPYNTFYRYMRLYDYLQASYFHKYTPDDGLYAMSMVYGYADDGSEGGAKPFPVRTIWSLVMDIDDLSLKI